MYSEFALFSQSKFKPEGVIGLSGKLPIIRLLPLSLPITMGFELTTLILYELPTVEFDGITALTLPELKAVKEPITEGLPKFPLESDNCTVKIFPLANADEVVNGTSIFCPAQSVLVLNEDVEILILP